MVQLEENVTDWLCSIFDLPRDRAGRPHHRWLDREPVGRGHRAPREARRGLPGRHVLRHRADARERHEGGGDRRASRAAASVWCPPMPSFGWIPRPCRTWSARTGRTVCGRSSSCRRPGTTNTGAVDPIGGSRTIAAAEGLWMHVDAAYGGFFQLTERGRARFRGIERADSITLDPHKGTLPALRDGRSRRPRPGGAPRGALRGRRLPPGPAAVGRRSRTTRSYSPELSRDMRGLRVWFPLVLHGVQRFRDALDEKLDLSEELDGLLREEPRLELPWSTQLTITPFRLRDADDDANRELLARINATKRVFLSSTVVDGRYTLRVAHREPSHASRSRPRMRGHHPRSRDRRSWGEPGRARAPRGPCARRAPR